MQTAQTNSAGDLVSGEPAAWIHHLGNCKELSFDKERRVRLILSDDEKRTITPLYDRPAAMGALVIALEIAKKELTHDVPESCYATGPLTGNYIEDLIVCPGCRAIEQINAALAKAAK